MNMTGESVSATERKIIVLEVILSRDSDELLSAINFETKDFTIFSNWEKAGNLEAVLEALRTDNYIKDFEIIGERSEEGWRVFDSLIETDKAHEPFSNTQYKITKGERYKEARKFVQDNTLPVFLPNLSLDHEDEYPEFNFDWETGKFKCGKTTGKFRKGDTYYNVMLEFTRYEGRAISYQRLLELMGKTKQAERIRELTELKKGSASEELCEENSKKEKAALKRSIFDFIKILKRKLGYSEVKNAYQIFEQTKEKGGGYIFRTPAEIFFENKNKRNLK